MRSPVSQRPFPGIHGMPPGSGSSMASNWWISTPALVRSVFGPPPRNRSFSAATTSCGAGGGAGGAGGE
eukprot:2524136-Prymnesium_polylepis.2